MIFNATSCQIFFNYNQYLLVKFALERVKWAAVDNSYSTVVFDASNYGKGEEPPRVVKNRNVLSHSDDLGYVDRMT